MERKKKQETDRACFCLPHFCHPLAFPPPQKPITRTMEKKWFKKKVVAENQRLYVYYVCNETKEEVKFPYEIETTIREQFRTEYEKELKTVLNNPLIKSLLDMKK